MTIRVEQLRICGTTLRLSVARFLPAGIAAGYGLFILSLYVRHDLIMYINPIYVVPTTLAGGILIALSCLPKPKTADSACGADSCCDDDACGCESASPRIWPYFALMIPLFLAALLPPQSLAAYSARQRGVQIAGGGAVRTTGTLHRVSLTVDTSTFGMQDWIGALSADPNPRDYLGKPIRLTGMVVHAPASVPAGYVMVLRYQVTCCIADARPVGLMVRDTSHGALHDNQWVSVVGKMGETKYQGQNMAVVEPTVMKPTKAGNPYMY